jgi:hypothetical protein
MFSTMSSADFWTLPLEIRTKIYVEVFRHLSWARKRKIRLYEPPRPPFQERQKRNYWAPELLRVSKRIQAEAGLVFYSNGPLTLILAVEQIQQMSLRAARTHVGTLEIWDATPVEIAGLRRSNDVRKHLDRTLSTALVEVFPNLKNLRFSFESMSKLYTRPEWKSLIQDLSSTHLVLSMNLRILCENEESCKETLEYLRALSGLPALRQLRLNMETSRWGGQMHPLDGENAREEILKEKTILQPFLTEVMAALSQVKEYDLRRVMHGCTGDGFIETSAKEIFATIEELEREPRKSRVDFSSAFNFDSFLQGDI